MTDGPKKQTLAVNAGIDTDKQHGCVVPSLHLSSTFSFAGYDEPRTYDYARSDNPTRHQLADALAKLEGGAGCAITGSGMAAIDLVLNLVKRGETVVAPVDCYGGTHRLLEARAGQGAFQVIYVDQSDAAAVEEAIAAKPAMVLVETPSNPLMRIADLEKICSAAKAVGALTAVDNTFLSPARQNPIKFGADFVIHSTTKYINGHSDVVGGAVIAASEQHAEDLCWWLNTTGSVGAPFDSYLTLRGLRTLFARIAAQEAAAAKIADALAAHPAVEKVYYPGLAAHPGHEVAARQQSGFGAMLSFEAKGGSAAVKAVLENVQLFTVAESLGGTESLIANPATMTHRAMPPEARAAAGLSDGLLRLSIGLEHAEDLLNDLDRALSHVKTGAKAAAE